MSFDPLKLTLSAGKDLKAELTLTPQPGATPILLNYSCVLDGDKTKEIVLEGIPSRADVLQVAVDALHSLGYPFSGRKPAKAKSSDKSSKTPPPV